MPNGGAEILEKAIRGDVDPLSITAFQYDLVCNGGSTAEGAPIIRSWAFLFMGKGIISRMDSSPARSMTIRSTEPEPEPEPDPKETAVETLLAEMSLEEKAGQLFSRPPPGRS